MKKNLTILTLIISLNSFAQKDTAISYSSVVNVDSVSKIELFERARLWVNETYKSGKDVIQFSDKESGQIACKALMIKDLEFKTLGIKSYMAFKIDYSFSIFVKDGKYKYVFENFNNSEMYNTSTYQMPQGFKVFGILTSSIKSPVDWKYYSEAKTNEKYITLKKLVNDDFKQTIMLLNDAMQKKSKASDF